MRRLTVLFDGDCGICKRAARWLNLQRQRVLLEFVPAGSPRARRLFPQLPVERTLEELHVVDEHGGVYAGWKAWTICLWALEDYSHWANALASPGRQKYARKVVAWVSRNRRKGDWFTESEPDDGSLTTAEECERCSP